MIDLRGKVALITGSTSGIGEAIAERLAGAGANIVLNGRRELSREIEEQLAALRKNYGVEAIYLRADMTKPGDVQNMVHTAAKTFGRLDILVNNAGMQHVHPVEQFPVSEFKEIIDCHLTGAFVAAQAAIPYMKEHGSGRIINILSAQAWDPQPNKIGYVSAKFGLRGLTEGLAVELAGTGITCNSISPGFVDTPLVQQQLEKRAKEQGISVGFAKTQLLRVHSTGEFVPVKEVTDLALSICSEKNHKTGRDYKADAGWTASASAKHLLQ